MTFSRVSAGWYACKVYKGKIGDDSVVMYLQFVRWSSVMDTSYKIIGSMFCFNKKEPIKLTGALIKNGMLSLSSREGKKGSKAFDLMYSDSSISGKQSSTGEQKAVFLTRYAEFNDTLSTKNSGEGITDILIDTSLKHQYMLAEYAKDKRTGDATIKALKIIDKKNNKLYQEISFSNLPYRVGAVMTPIFQNITVGDFNKDGHEDIRVWANVGRVGSELFIYYDPQSRKYSLDNIPRKYGYK